MESDVDFDSAHEHTLPERIDDGWGALAASQTHGLPPLSIRLSDGRAWCYAEVDGSIDLSPGSEAATLVEVTEADWQGLWASTETPMGLLMNQRAKILAGQAGDFVQWETALRVLYEELPPWDPTQPIVGADGSEIDAAQSFHSDDDPIRMAEFLDAAGFIHVRDVLPPSDVEGLVEAASTARQDAVDGDGQSWWSTHEDGRRMLARVVKADVDPRMRALPSDPRLLEIVRLSTFDLEPTPDQGVSVLFKQSRMVSDAMADQPWHRDCGLGGHKTMCPLMNGSLFLTAANRETGELRFLPGSWRTAGFRFHDPDHQLGVGIEAGPGDFLLHYGDGLHAGTPPTSEEGPFRWSAVFEYGPVGRTAEQSQEYYDQVMLTSEPEKILDS